MSQPPPVPPSISVPVAGDAALSPPAVPPPPIPVKVRRPIWKSWRAWTVLVLIVVVGFLSIGAVLAKRIPAWYHPADVNRDDVRLAGEAFRNSVIGKHRNSLERVATGTPQVIEINEDNLNAFLAVQYAAEENTKRPITDPMVVFSGGRVTVAARAKDVAGIGSGVLSFQFHVDVFPPEDAGKDPSTLCALVIDAVSIGELPVPLWLAKEKIAKAVSDLAPAVDAAAQAARRKDAPETHVAEIRDFLMRIARGDKVAVPYEYHGGIGGAKDVRSVFLQSVVVEEKVIKVTFWDQPLKK